MKKMLMFAAVVLLGGKAWAQSDARFLGKWVVAEVKLSPNEGVDSPLLSPERIAAYAENFKKSATFEFFNHGKATVAAFGSSGEGNWRYDAAKSAVVFSVSEKSESVPVRFLESGAMEMTRDIPGLGKVVMYLTKS